MRLPSRWKGKVGHTGDLGECRGGTAGGALGSDDMAGSVGSSVLVSGGWAAGERMPRPLGPLLLTWGAKGAGGYRAFCEAFGIICCQELSLSSQPFVGACCLPSVLDTNLWHWELPQEACPTWSHLGCSRKPVPREEPGLFDLSVARIIPHI